MAEVNVFASKVDETGRILLPAKVRRKLSLRSGSAVLLRVKANTLELTTPEQAARAAQDFVCSLAPGVSLSRELIRERRREARRELKD